jgi:uncharacterized protein
MNSNFNSLSTQIKTKSLSKVDYILVHVTHGCNIKCTYCYINANDNSEEKMHIETYKNAIKSLLDNTQKRKINLVFHGGEPLLLKRNWYKYAIDFTENIARKKGITIRYQMQSNCVDISSEIIELIKEYNICIGGSCDGPISINNPLRPYSEKATKGLLMLKEAGVMPGIICLISPYNYMMIGEIIYYFEKEGLNHLMFNHLLNIGRGKVIHKLTSDQLFQAKKIILDYMIEKKGEGVIDSNLRHTIGMFILPPKNINELTTCYKKHCSAGKELITFTMDGTLYPCCLGFNKKWALGSFVQGIDESYYEETLRKFHEQVEWYKRCDSCKALKICNFGCTAVFHESVESQIMECEFTQKLYEYMIARKKEIKELFNILFNDYLSDYRILPRQILDNRNKIFKSINNLDDVSGIVHLTNSKYFVLQVNNRRLFFNKSSRKMTELPSSPMINDKKKYVSKKADDFISDIKRPVSRSDVFCSTVGNEVVLYDPKQNLTHILNNSAMNIWDLCDGSNTVNDIVNKLDKLYGIESNTLQKDVNNAVAAFKKQNLLQR